MRAEISFGVFGAYVRVSVYVIEDSEMVREMIAGFFDFFGRCYYLFFFSLYCGYSGEIDIRLMSLEAIEFCELPEVG